MAVIPTIIFIASALIPFTLSDKEQTAYYSLSGFELLMKNEERLVEEMETAVDRYGRDTDNITQALANYTQRYRRVMSGNRSLSDISSHPINGFHFLRDVVLDWAKIMAAYSIDKNKNQEYVSLIGNLSNIRDDANYPVTKDIKIVARSVITMQRLCDLNITDMIEGKIVDRRTNKVYRSLHSLNSYDCITFAKAAFAEAWYDTAVDWIQTAKMLSENGDDSYAKTAIANLLEETITKHDRLLLKYGANHYNLDTYPFPIDKELMKGHEDQFGSPVRGYHPQLFSALEDNDIRANRGKLCQGQRIRERILVDILVCRYLTNDDPYLLIGPFKVEELSRDPALLVYHDFVYESEVKAFKELAEPELEDSVYSRGFPLVIKKGNNKISKEAHFYEEDEPVLVPRIAKRVQAATKLSTRSDGRYESIKVANYGVAGHYGVHKDYYQDSKIPNDENDKLKPDGDKIATLIMYLSEVESGGATVFPFVGVTAWPAYRSAVLWYNLYRDGSPDQFTRHSGCPVLYGSKWIAILWPREYPQMFRAPCGLRESDKHRLL